MFESLVVPAAAGPTAFDLVRGASPLLSSAGAKAGGPSRAESSQYSPTNLTLGFDNSGWTVATSKGRASAERSQSAAGAASSLVMVAGLLLAGVLAWRALS
jgi:hypothetical protein